MIQPSTILIADISGFTNFVSTTELDHSSHIINELLEVIVESNSLGLTVSEIEGDAVLFYKPGEPIPCETLVSQCLSSFEKFHETLKLIERDTICKCGACQTASGLGLKFVSHFGDLKEISVANFRKASGLDMIVAHRLLKNDIEGNEYVIVTDKYAKALEQTLGCNLNWSSHTLSYPDIGEVGVTFAQLDEIKNKVPDPPTLENPVVPAGDDAFELSIDAALFKVYAALIDIDKKRDWVIGLEGIDNEMTTARIGQRHLCYLGGMKIDFELLRGEIGSGTALYSERADFRGMGYSHQQTFTLTEEDDGQTGLHYEVSWEKNPDPPDDMKQMWMGGIQSSLESFKRMLES